MLSASKCLEINSVNYHFYLPKTPKKAGWGEKIKCEANPSIPEHKVPLQCKRLPE
jgi:hypothetical protein